MPFLFLLVSIDKVNKKEKKISIYVSHLRNGCYNLQTQSFFHEIIDLSKTEKFLRANVGAFVAVRDKNLHNVSINQ